MVSPGKALSLLFVFVAALGVASGDKQQERAPKNLREGLQPADPDAPLLENQRPRAAPPARKREGLSSARRRPKDVRDKARPEAPKRRELTGRADAPKGREGAPHKPLPEDLKKRLLAHKKAQMKAERKLGNYGSYSYSYSYWYWYSYDYHSMYYHPGDCYLDFPVCAGLDSEEYCDGTSDCDSRYCECFVGELICNYSYNYCDYSYDDSEAS